MSRRKNAVEEIEGKPRAWSQFLARRFGRDAADWKTQVVDAGASISLLLRMFEDSPEHKLARRFKRQGWRMMLRKVEESDICANLLQQGVLHLLIAAEVAWRSRDASLLRQIADALERINQPELTTNLDSYLFGFIEGSTKRGWKQSRFETAEQLHRRFPQVTRKTIYKRAKALGVVLKKDRKGAPPGLRKSTHRARR